MILRSTLFEIFYIFFQKFAHIWTPQWPWWSLHLTWLAKDSQYQLHRQKVHSPNHLYPIVMSPSTTLLPKECHFHYTMSNVFMSICNLLSLTSPTTSLLSLNNLTFFFPFFFLSLTLSTTLYKQFFKMSEAWAFNSNLLHIIYVTSLAFKLRQKHEGIWSQVENKVEDLASNCAPWTNH